MPRYRVTFTLYDPYTDYTSFREADIDGWSDSSGNVLPIESGTIEVESLADPLQPGYYRHDGKLYQIYHSYGTYGGWLKGVEIILPVFNEKTGTLSPAAMGTPFSIVDHDAWSKAEKVDL